jgi:hypothetical protein
MSRFPSTAHLDSWALSAKCRSFDGQGIAEVDHRYRQRSPAWRVRSAPMVGSAVRPLCQAWPAHVTDSLNAMATNLTGQARKISQATTTVAR